MVSDSGSLIHSIRCVSLSPKSLHKSPVTSSTLVAQPTEAFEHSRQLHQLADQAITFLNIQVLIRATEQRMGKCIYGIFIHATWGRVNLVIYDHWSYDVNKKNRKAIVRFYTKTILNTKPCKTGVLWIFNSTLMASAIVIGDHITSSDGKNKFFLAMTFDWNNEQSRKQAQCFFFNTNPVNNSQIVT